ncbi:MAG: hypothetical protein V4736_08365 [Bdellovibrionota bacterium]
MKTLLFSLVTVVAIAASAVVKPVGTFEPTLCSLPAKKGQVTIQIVALERVCLGWLSGTNQQAAVIYINDGSSRQYNITMPPTPPTMGPSVAKFSGAATDGSNDKIAGELTTVSGITVSHSVKLKTKSNLKYIGNLQVIYVAE